MASPFTPPTLPGAAGYPLGLTGATAATRYVGGTASGAPGSGTFAVGDFVIDQSGAVIVCTVAGSPGTWVTVGGGGGGLFDAYAQVSCTRAANTANGASTAAGWTIYPITTEDFDTAALLAVGSSQITLAAGTYFADGWLTVTLPQARAQAKLVNISDTADLLTGNTGYFGGTTIQTNLRCTVRGRFTIAAQKVLELQYRVQAGVATEGLGTPDNFGVSEKYAELTFWRET